MLAECHPATFLWVRIVALKDLLSSNMENWAFHECCWGYMDVPSSCVETIFIYVFPVGPSFCTQFWLVYFRTPVKQKQGSNAGYGGRNEKKRMTNSKLQWQDCTLEDPKEDLSCQGLINTEKIYLCNC